MNDADFGSRLRFDGRAAAVVGAGSGIGQATAVGLAGLGADVVCIDLDGDAARATADTIGAAALQADATDPAALGRALEAAAKLVGPIRTFVDVVGVPELGLLEELDEVRWRRQFDHTLHHAFDGLRAVAPAMAREGGGSVVFVGSNAGVMHVPGMLAYGTAKAALHHFVGSTGRELAPRGIRVNGVAPGFTRTAPLEALVDEEGWCRVSREIPLGAPATPDEIASVACFLASDLASYVTGQVLVADGGRAGSARSPALTD